MSDPLSITAGVVTLLAFAGSTLTKGYCILRSLQDSAKDVKLLLAELSQLTGILVAIEAQAKQAQNKVNVNQGEDSSVSEILDSSVPNCRKMMGKVWVVLQKLEKSRRAVLAIKWQFLEPEVKKLIQEIEHYKTVFVLCLGIDVGRKTEEILELQRTIFIQLEGLRDEKEKAKAAAEGERARSNRQALMRWLIPKSDEIHAKALRLWTPGTGDWLIGHADFISWVEGPQSLLWLNGIPGSGKTILMSRIVENLKTKLTSSLKPGGLTYFFCTYNASEANGLCQILCSLAAHLIRCLPQPETGAAMRLFEECDDGTLIANPDRIQNLLIDLMNGMEAVFVCLDALDECNRDTKVDLLQFIHVVRDVRGHA